MTTHRTVNGNRPEACMQAVRAQQHDENLSYKHKAQQTKIALKPVYKHVLPNNMRRNSFMTTHRTVNGNRPEACMQAFPLCGPETFCFSMPQYHRTT